MMLHRHPAQMAALSLALLFGLCSPTFAWDFFKKKCCHHDDSSRSGETRSETMRVSRSGPAIGTIFMPIAGVGFGFGGGSRDAADDEDTTLNNAMLAAKAQLRQEITRSTLKAEVDAKQRFLERLIAPTPSTSSDQVTNIDKRLAEINESIQKVEKRIVAVEQLTLLHDNVLKEHLKIEKRIIAIEQGLLLHDNLFKEHVLKKEPILPPKDNK